MQTYVTKIHVIVLIWKIFYNIESVPYENMMEVQYLMLTSPVSFIHPTGFLNLGATDIWGWIILGWGRGVLSCILYDV